jgi:nitrogen fixation protein FixH
VHARIVTGAMSVRHGFVAIRITSAIRAIGAIALAAAFLVAVAGAAAAASPDWKIAVEQAPKIRSNYPTDVRVRITDSKGKPVTGATVELVITMIDMDHGEHKSKATMSAPGVYDGKTTFFMVGAWWLEVRAKRGNEAMSHKVKFDIPPG